ncbi:Beta-barrel assembly-enhancing protease [subsurface metagenome]
MLNWNRCAKINVKVLIILIIVTVAIGTSLFAARHIRRNILSEMSLKAGEAAFENKDWPAAYRNFRGYLGRNPDDVEILKKYAKAAMSIRPLDAKTIGGAIAAYRRVMQLDTLDEIAYEKLAMLYTGIGNFEELAYIARKRLADVPNDRKTPLHLAEALMQLNKTQEAEQELLKFIEELKALPDKHVEYVRACVLMSNIEGSKDSPVAKTKALEWLNDAIDYAPESIEALASRARFHRQMAEIPGTSEEGRLALLGLARKDLEAADNLGTGNPLLLYSLGAEWMALGELDRAGVELRLAENLPLERLEEHFFDLNDWAVARFRLASELVILRAATTESASLADKALAVLTERRHRVRILPSAIRLYIVAGKVVEARRCLDEYLDTMYTPEGQKESDLMLTFLQALVAKAEDDSYAVINALQPAVMSGVYRPELWGLLAEAFSRTDQTRRAVSALNEYLRIRPQDSEMTQQLTKEYLKLRNWSKALRVAQLAESMNPTEIILKLLRIEASINITAQQQEMITAKRQALADEVNELAQLRKEHPDSVDIRILQAIIAIYLEEPDKAERELKMAIEECEEPLRAEMQLVRHYYRTKRMPEAVSVCKTACKRHSEVAEPWLALSSLHVSNADYDLALRCLRQGLGDVVGRWEKRQVSIQLALLELMHGDRASGIKLLTELASQDKREVHVRSLLLGIREVQDDQAKVQELIRELRDAERESGLMWRLHQADVWLSSDEWRSKQQDIDSYLQYCINSDPEWSSPVLLLGEMHGKLENFRRVEDIYRQALIRNPSATDIAEKLLIFLERQGRFLDAKKVFQQIEKDARLASGWKFREAIREGDFYRAIQELKIRVSNNDQDASSRILLARLVYWQTGDVDQAFEYLKKAEAINQGSRALTAVRASILRAEGKTKEAQQILDDYVASRDDFTAYWMRAVYITEEGELERAEKDYRKLTTFAEQGAIGYELLSNFYVNPKNKQLDKAVEALEEGLDVYPEDLRLKRRLMKTLFLRADAQDKQKALEILATLEEQLPQDPELMKLRAVQMLEESTPQSLKTAREKLENVIKLEPIAVDAYLLLIGIAMQEGDYEAARDFAIRAIGSNPNNLPLLLARGRAELELGNIQMAVELANLVLQKAPTNTGALGVLLDSAIRSGNNSLIEDATALARLMLEEDPNKTEVRDVIVTKAIESKDRSLLEVARTLIESALGSNPTDEKLLISRARVLVAMDLPQSAIPELESYCQTKEASSSIAAIVTLADLYRISGDMDQAEQRIQQAERMDQNNQDVIHARFIWLVAQNRFEELAGISSAYLSAKELNPTTLLRAASVLASLDSITLKKEGLKLFEQAATLSPTLLDARLGLASTLCQTGNVERAKQIYQELLEQYPNNIQVLNDLAWILQEHDHRYAAALELANRGLSLAPNELHLLDTRGTILSNIADRLADARSDFERLVELSPSDTPRQAKALLQLGRICAKLDDFVQAEQHLKNALEIDRKLDVFTTDERSEITRILQRSEMQAVKK